MIKSFNLKIKNKPQTRISHLLLIPAKPESDPLEKDIIDFFYKTYSGLCHQYTKSRVYPYPVFLAFDQEQYTLKYLLQRSLPESQLPLTIHVIAHGEPDDFQMLDNGINQITALQLAKEIHQIFKETGWKNKKITFHFHTCDSAHPESLTREQILQDSFIGIFWSYLSQQTYQIEVIGYPGLYCSLQSNSGHAVIEVNNKTFERSKAEVRIDEKGNVIIPDLNKPKKPLHIIGR